jgi:hypothetical protein
MRTAHFANPVSLILGGLLAAGCGAGGRSGDAAVAPPVDAGALPPDLAIPPSPANAFPAAPVMDTSAPASAPQLFAAQNGSAVGPCLAEPQPGALIPRNWIRPRFAIVATPDQNLFEIRLHVGVEPNDLLVYTMSTSWTMSLEMWQALAVRAADMPISVTVRGVVYNADQGVLVGAPALGTQTTITIAPVVASGTVMYWTTSEGSAIKGFEIGQEQVRTVLTPSQVKMRTVGGATVTCIGCHTSTPDALSLGMTAQSPWGNVLASAETESVGQVPPWLGAGAQAALQKLEDLGIQTYSPAHWATGDRMVVSPLGSHAMAQLIWMDLEAKQPDEGTAWGVLARGGDTRGAGAPAWSHDGNTIAYVSTDAESTGRLDQGDADIYLVPWAERAGGTAAPLAGASDPSLDEYYPAWSADDRLIAFDRAPGGAQMYNQSQAEVFVVPSTGGTAVRLAANDPPACGGARPASPGVTNSWPKWSPDVQTAGTRSFYWITFSSTRAGGGVPQLYVAPVVVDRASGGAAPKITTYPALYPWNQPATEHNHTPAWNTIVIP